MFEGGGFADDLVNVAIDDVSVKTENCVLLPYYAKPGYFILSFLSLFSSLQLTNREALTVLSSVVKHAGSG